MFNFVTWLNKIEKILLVFLIQNLYFLASLLQRLESYFLIRGAIVLNQNQAPESSTAEPPSLSEISFQRNALTHFQQENGSFYILTGAPPLKVKPESTTQAGEPLAKTAADPFSEGNAIVYCEGAFGTPNGKTAHGLVRRTSRYRILAVVDSQLAGKDASLILTGKGLDGPRF